MTATVATEGLALLALLLEKRSKWASLRSTLEAGDRPTAVLQGLLGNQLLDDDFNESLETARGQVEAWHAQGIRTTTFLDAEYPPQLLSVHDFPPVIFTKGTFSDADALSVAVVGTRGPSEGALRFIRDLTAILGSEGIPIVSGLARGVDTAAIRGSLASQNRTIGVIGTGLNRYYPTENRDLQDEVATNHLLISQFWPDAPPTRQSFPMRNHVMSAFASATVIIEASENSGTRIQARAAVKHGRPLILTRAVATQTRWGADLVDKGVDVQVVNQPADALIALRRAHGAQSEEAYSRFEGTLR
jgi:DNA processing protein